MGLVAAITTSMCAFRLTAVSKRNVQLFHIPKPVGELKSIWDGTVVFIGGGTPRWVKISEVFMRVSGGVLRDPLFVYFRVYNCFLFDIIFRSKHN